MFRGQVCLYANILLKPYDSFIDPYHHDHSSKTLRRNNAYVIFNFETGSICNI